MSVATLNMVRLDRRRSASLQSQLYRQIRERIISGQLKAGIRLASTRDLVGQLGVSRNTIVYALDQLVAEGYLISRIGSGIYVSDLRIGTSKKVRENNALDTTRKGGQISKTATRLLTVSISPAYASTQVRPFRPCQPAVDHFPTRNWNRARSYALRLPATELFGEGDPAGSLRLRRALSIYLQDARGVRCHAEQIVITAGTQQALSLIGAALLNPGDSVWLEDPGYLGARAALLAAEAAIVPIPVDADGITIPALNKKPRLIYVTPSRQFPLGVTMSLPRRLALLEYARRNDALVIEDDYDSEFRYVDRPLPSLQGLTDEGQVIYTGSFSKVLFPSLRLGYVVLPEGLFEILCKLKEIRDAAVSTLDQATAAVFLEEGFFSTHLRRMRRLYRERLEVFLEEAQKHTAGWLSFPTIEAGMDAVGSLQAGADDAKISNQLAAAGITVPPLSAYSLSPSAPGLLFGFTAFSIPQIRSAMKTIAEVIRV